MTQIKRIFADKKIMIMMKIGKITTNLVLKNHNDQRHLRSIYHC